MAILEKIRSKSVLLFVIIAVALLAFILGDFFTTGRTFFGTGTTIAKVDGQKIDIMEFQKRLNDASEQARSQGRNVDAAVLQQQVLDGMIAEALLNNELDKLGITVTDAELTDVMLGEHSGMLDRMVQQQYGVESAAMLHDMAFNPSKYQITDPQQIQQLTNTWLTLEKNITEQLRQSKFQNLFMGTLVANDLDARAIYDENASTSNIIFAKKDFATLDDSKYEVTDADIEALYKEQRNRFRLTEPTRLVKYVAVEVAPSPEDLRAGNKKVEDALNALRTQEGTTGLEDMNEFVVTRHNTTRGNIRDNQLKAFVDSAAVGTARIVSHNGTNYTLAKLMGRSSEIDSVNIDVVAVQGNRAAADSILASLRGGKRASDMQGAANVAGVNDSVWVSLTDPNYAQLGKEIADVAAGQWFTPDTVGENYRLFRVRTRRPAVTVYDIAEATFVVEPSAATLNKLESDLARFLNANPTAAAFAENAQASGYTLQDAVVTPSTPRVGTVNDSREGVAWAMEAKKGQVSPLFGGETAGRFYAVALEDVYNGDFVPANAPVVRERLEARARNNKKAADLMAQYDGKAKDVQGYAKLMGTQVDTTTVSFGQIFVPKIGVNESKLAAASSAAKPGELVGPVQGNNGVIVFTVTSVDNSGRPFNVDESAMQFNQARGAQLLSRSLVEILRGNKKVQNNSLKFYNR
ncbi:MAG: hypothetical protein HDS11_05375 [Bacteroides sp.]|nr:hypothetical protein [Bacteroides sp.]